MIERPRAYQRWTVTFPDNGDGFDAWVPNLYAPKQMMVRLVESAGCRAVAEDTDSPPPDLRLDAGRAR